MRQKVAVVLLLLAGAVAGFGAIAGAFGAADFADFAGVSGVPGPTDFADAFDGSELSAAASPEAVAGDVFATSELGTVVSVLATAEFSWAVLGEAVGVSLEAAVVEEIVFRGVLLWVLAALFAKGGERGASQEKSARAARAAVLASALVFGVLHLLPDGPLVSEDAWRAALSWCAAASDPAALATGVLVAQGVLKVAQATAFGYLMGLFVVRSRWFTGRGWRRAFSLAVPIALHFAFDLLCLGAPLAWGIVLPDSYLTGRLSDVMTLAISGALLLAAIPLAKSSR